MTDVILYSFHNTAPWWHYLANNLKFANSVKVISDIRGDGDLCVVDSFYYNIRNKNCELIAIQNFSELGCNDIIRRCRVLRNQKKTRALAMIGSMWLVFDDIIRRERPKLVMSFIVDRYVMDVLDRVLETYNIHFLGMTASILSNYVMFLNKGGRLISLRQPEASEVEKAREELLSDSFTPSYVIKKNKFTLVKFWRIFLYFKLRGLFFNFIRYIKRDKLNLHYLDALNSLDHKPTFLDFETLNYLDDNWGQVLINTAKDKRIFLAMQLLPEASLDYWLRDISLLDNEKVMLQISEVLNAAGYTVFVKDHPLQFGFRKRAVIQRLAKMPKVILVPYEIPANYLIKECPITVTLTGTIGFQSVVAGSCSIVSGAYYSDQEHFIHFNNFKEIELLPEKIKIYQETKQAGINDEGINALLKKILSASIPGDLFSFRSFDQNKPEYIRKTATLVNSLNKYLSQFC